MAVIQEPQRWLDRLVGTCVNVLIGALALYGAVWLLRAIWPELVMVTLLGACVVGLISWWRVRRSGW